MCAHIDVSSTFFALLLLLCLLKEKLMNKLEFLFFLLLFCTVFLSTFFLWNSLTQCFKILLKCLQINKQTSLWIFVLTYNVFFFAGRKILHIKFITPWVVFELCVISNRSILWTYLCILSNISFFCFFL